jgi:hypothetical protein
VGGFVKRKKLQCSSQYYQNKEKNKSDEKHQVMMQINNSFHYRTCAVLEEHLPWGRGVIDKRKHLLELKKEAT